MYTDSDLIINDNELTILIYNFANQYKGLYKMSISHYFNSNVVFNNVNNHFDNDDKLIVIIHKITDPILGIIQGIKIFNIELIKINIKE